MLNRAKYKRFIDCKKKKMKQFGDRNGREQEIPKGKDTMRGSISRVVGTRDVPCVSNKVTVI